MLLSSVDFKVENSIFATFVLKLIKVTELSVVLIVLVIIKLFFRVLAVFSNDLGLLESDHLESLPIEGVDLFKH